MEKTLNGLTADCDALLEQLYAAIATVEDSDTKDAKRPLRYLYRACEYLEKASSFLNAAETTLE